MADLYVDGDNGSDANDGSTESLAKATISAAVSAAADNDRVLIQNNGSTVYNEAVTWSDKGLTLEGYGSTVGDQTRAVLDGSNTLANGIDFTNTTSTYTLRFQNLEIRHYTDDGIEINRTGGGNNSTALFDNLHIHDCTGDGIWFNTLFANSRPTTFTRCRIERCANGVTHDNAKFFIALCQILDNSATGVNIDSSTALAAMAYCTVAKNSINLNGNFLLTNVTLDAADGSDNLITRSDSFSVAVSTGFTNAAAYGIDPANTDRLSVFGCGFFANTTAAIDGTPLIETGSVTGSDPQYADAANFDFTPAPTSPWKQAPTQIGRVGAAQTTYSDIGAAQLQAPPAGGLLMPNKRGNKQ